MRMQTSAEVGILKAFTLIIIYLKQICFYIIFFFFFSFMSTVSFFVSFKLFVVDDLRIGIGVDTWEYLERDLGLDLNGVFIKMYLFISVNNCNKFSLLKIF